MEGPVLPRWVRVHHCDGDGVSFEETLKAWKVEQGAQVHWEVRRLFHATVASKDLEGSATEPLYRWLHRRRPRLQAAFQALGLSWDTALIKSRHAHACAKASSAMVDLTQDSDEEAGERHQEHALETGGAMAWLLVLPRLVRRTSLGVRALCVLEALLEKLVPGDEVDNMLCDMPQEMLAHCSESVLGQPCSHMATLLATQAAPGQPPQRRLCSVLQAAMEWQHCEAVRIAFHQWLQRVGKFACQELDFIACDDDPLAQPWAGPRDIPPRKRLRWDEDFKNALVTKYRVRAQAPRALNKALRTGADSSSVDYWQQAHLAQYVAQAWASFQGVQSLSLCCDATRIGRPGEETYIGFVYSVARGFGVWLPVQVGASEGQLRGWFFSGFFWVRVRALVCARQC